MTDSHVAANMQDAQRAIQELSTRVAGIRQKALESDVMVEEICRGIRRLDGAKEHLTVTCSTLEKLKS